MYVGKIMLRQNEYGKGGSKFSLGKVEKIFLARFRLANIAEGLRKVTHERFKGFA